MDEKNRDLLTVIAITPIIDALNREGRGRKDTSEHIEAKDIEREISKIFSPEFENKLVIDLVLRKCSEEEIKKYIRDKIEADISSFTIGVSSTLQSSENEYRKISNQQLKSLETAEGGYYWNGFNELLKDQSKKDQSNAIIRLSLGEETNRILSFMPDPSQDQSFHCYGMVIGDVQSGKTQNYSGLVNKAADLGYKLILVLTGTTEE